MPSCDCALMHILHLPLPLMLQASLWPPRVVTPALAGGACNNSCQAHGCIPGSQPCSADSSSSSDGNGWSGGRYVSSSEQGGSSGSESSSSSSSSNGSAGTDVRVNDTPLSSPSSLSRSSSEEILHLSPPTTHSGAHACVPFPQQEQAVRDPPSSTPCNSLPSEQQPDLSQLPDFSELFSFIFPALAGASNTSGQQQQQQQRQLRQLTSPMQHRLCSHGLYNSARWSHPYLPWLHCHWTRHSSHNSHRLAHLELAHKVPCQHSPRPNRHPRMQQTIEVPRLLLHFLRVWTMLEFTLLPSLNRAVTITFLMVMGPVSLQLPQMPCPHSPSLKCFLPRHPLS